MKNPLLKSDEAPAQAGAACETFSEDERFEALVAADEAGRYSVQNSYGFEIGRRAHLADATRLLTTVAHIHLRTYPVDMVLVYRLINRENGHVVLMVALKKKSAERISAN